MRTTGLFRVFRALHADKRPRRGASLPKIIAEKNDKNEKKKTKHDRFNFFNTYGGGPSYIYIYYYKPRTVSLGIAVGPLSLPLHLFGFPTQVRVIKSDAAAASAFRCVSPWEAKAPPRPSVFSRARSIWPTDFARPLPARTIGTKHNAPGRYVGF